MKGIGPALPGLILCAIGAFMMFGPMMLPRAAFGELGHGDGMGLIGLFMLGGALLFAGAVAAIVGLAIAARFEEKQKSSADRTSQ